MNGTFAIDGIGLLVTNDPALGDGPLGIRKNAAVVIADGVVAAVEEAGVDVDQRVEAAGRCVIPGFVDSHTHLVFAGDRAEEFVSRMAGQPYEAGGIRVTTEATRMAGEGELVSLADRRCAEARHAGITHLEIKSGYSLDVAGEERCCRIAKGLTDDVTFLGAHVVPPEYGHEPDTYVELVCGPMLDACAPYCRWVDVFCERGAFDTEQSRAVLEAGRAAGLGLRVHANQLGHGGGVQLAVELDAASADHCNFLDDDDVEALAASETVATLLPATDFSTRAPYADGRRLVDAGVTIAIATNCNPGSSYTTSMGFCLAVAVRDMGLTVEEALQAATVGGARALRRTDIGRLSPGARADVVVLEAPSYAHLVYRPGVPLVHTVVEAGHVLVGAQPA